MPKNELLEQLNKIDLVVFVLDGKG